MPPDSGTVTDGHLPHLSQDPRNSGPHPRAGTVGVHKMAPLGCRWHYLGIQGCPTLCLVRASRCPKEAVVENRGPERQAEGAIRAREAGQGSGEASGLYF